MYYYSSVYYYSSMYCYVLLCISMPSRTIGIWAYMYSEGDDKTT